MRASAWPLFQKAADATTRRGVFFGFLRLVLQRVQGAGLRRDLRPRPLADTPTRRFKREERGAWSLERGHVLWSRIAGQESLSRRAVCCLLRQVVHAHDESLLQVMYYIVMRVNLITVPSYAKYSMPLSNNTTTLFGLPHRAIGALYVCADTLCELGLQMYKLLRVQSLSAGL